MRGSYQDININKKGAGLWSWSLAAVALVFSLSNLVLGWGLGINLLTRGREDLAAMIPETATCFAILSLAQIILVSRRIYPRLVIGLSVAAPVLAWLTIAVIPHENAFLGPNDRMSFATGVIVTLLGLGKVLGLRGKRMRGVSALLAVAALALGLGGIASFMFNVTELERYVLFRGLSIPTSVVTCVLALSLLAADAELRAIGILFSPSAGGRLVRRFGPVAVLGPVVVTLVGDLAADFDWISPNARLAVLAVTLIGLSFGFVLMVGLSQDTVTEREQAFLRMLEDVLEGIEAGIVVLSPEGQPILTNPGFRKLTGAGSARDWLTSGGFRAVDGDHELEGHLHPVQRALSGEVGVMAFRDDGAGHDLVLQFSGFEVAPNSAGGLQRVLVVNDMTDAWRQRAIMAQTERLNAVGQLAAGIAHEVTNIFGVVKLAAGTAQLLAPDAAPDQYAAILNACRRGGSLAERLQRLSVVPTGAERTIEVGSTLGVALDLAERGLPAGITLRRVLPTGPLSVTCDPLELEMAVLNLVLNARNAIVEEMNGTGAITVTVTARDGEVGLHVSDTGPGIPPQFLERVREPFFTTRSSKGGTGFGLALIDMFATRAGGRLEFHSADGQGAEVEIVLPLTDMAPDWHNIIHPRPADLSGLRLLVVEEDLAFQEMLKQSLSLLGAEVICAQGVAEAIQTLVGEAHFDVMISAMNMQGALSGPSLASRAIRDRPGLGVVFVTADRVAQQDDGDLPGPVLFKPVDLGQLSRVVTEVAEGASGSG